MDVILAYSNERTRYFKRMQFMRFASENLLLILMQYIGISISTSFSNVLPISFATGTAVAFIFIRGMRILPGILVGSFPGYYFLTDNPALSTLVSIINAFQVSGLFLMCHQFAIPTLVFTGFKQCFMAIMVFIIVFVPTNIIIEMMLLKFHYHYALTQFFSIQSSLADVLGIICLSMPMITWELYYPDLMLMSKREKRLIMLRYGLLSALIMTLILSNNLYFIIAIALLLSISSIIITTKHGWCGAALILCMMGVLINMAVYLQTPI